jgi:hypothetical protein
MLSDASATRCIRAGNRATLDAWLALVLRMMNVIQQGHRVLYREAHTLVDEPADAQLTGTAS